MALKKNKTRYHDIFCALGGNKPLTVARIESGETHSNLHGAGAEEGDEKTITR
jgi:hypothetical protein